MTLSPPISPGRPRQWTHERAISAYLAAAERLGRAPGLAQMSADEQCDLPRAQIYRLFGGIEQLAEAAGMPYQRATNTRYTPRRMLRRLTWLAEELGCAPTPNDYRHHYRNGYAYLVRAWGSFDGALAAAGIDQTAQMVSAEMAINALRACASDLSATPTWRQYRLWAMDVDEQTGEVSYGPQRPSVHVLRSLLDSWNGALAAAGLAPDARAQERDCIDALAACAAELQHVPTATGYRAWAASTTAPSMSELLRVLGSWNEALGTAELEAHMRRWTATDVRDWMGTWRQQVKSTRQPHRAQWDAWADIQQPRAPRSATVARLAGSGSWREAWRSRFPSS
jgi:hypothetical protein